MFQAFDGLLQMDQFFADGVPVKFIPYILFLTVIGVFYIGNGHHAERNIREITTLQREVEDLRADYTTLKAEYMFGSKQSEVAKKIAPKGLKESLTPPEKIEISRHEY